MKNKNLYLLICLLLFLRSIPAFSACSGGTFSTATGSVNDGSGAGNYSNAEACNQLIAPGPGYNSITLTFATFVTQSGADFVTVYDGPTTASPILAQYSGDLSASLPSVTSTGNQMLVRFTSDASVVASGWSANYVSNVYCGGTTNLTASSGNFSDGSTSGLYLPGTDCNWFINPGAAFSSITLSFSAFQLESGGGPFDYVKVYTGSTASPGNLQATYSGSSIPPSAFYPNNQLFVVFHSDGSNQFQGFDASYQAHYCFGTTNYTSTSGSFGDGSGANNYLDNSTCSWFINPPLGPLETVGLSFANFSTEFSLDKVNIYNGSSSLAPLLASYSGGTLPAAVHTTNGTPMFVEFITDGSVVKPGWFANYVVNCTPVISIAGNNVICAGSSTTFTATSIVNGGTTPIVEWFVNNVSQGISATFTSSTLTNGAVVTAKLTSNAPCAYPLTVVSNAVTMTVWALPTIGIISLPDPPVVCENDYVTLSGTGALSYAWDNGITNGVAFQPPVGVTTYTVTGTDLHGCTNTASIDVTVNPLPHPEITSSTGSFQFCNHTSIILDASTGFGSPYVSYLWSIGATTQAIATNSGATYTVTVTDANGCVNDTSVTTIRLTSVPPRPGYINGDVYGRCNTSGNVYYINSVPTASSYLWTVTNGIITSGQGDTLITVDFLGFTTSTITVRAVNECGNSSSRTRTIYAKPEAPLTINGNKNGVCKKTGEVYSVDPVDGATYYTWTVPAGVSITGGQGTTDLTVDFLSTFVSGSICCRAENACGTSAYVCISVKAIPQKPVIIYGPTSVCMNSAGNAYWTPPVYGADTYIWDVPHGAWIATGAGTPSVVITMGTHSGQVEVWASNSCGTSADYDLNVYITCREAADMAQDEINAYPNPVHAQLNLNIASSDNKKCTLRMIDVIGKQMFIDNIELAKGENLHQYDVSQFAPGIYFIVIDRENMPSQTMRIVVE